MITKKKIQVKTFTSISEKEARDLILMTSGRPDALIDPIRNKMIDLISKGQRYGLVTAEDVDKQPISLEDAKKLAVMLHVSFKKSGYAVKYIPSKNSFLYVPTEKLTEMLAKQPS